MAPFGNQRGRGGFRGRGRGGSRGGRGGPKLPATLRDQVTETYGQSSKGKDRRRFDDQIERAPKRRPTTEDDEDEDQSSRAGSSRRPAVVTGKAKAAVRAPSDPPPKKKKKRELQLPTAQTDDAEDGEIEWLEYALRKEKGKGKEEDSDGLDGTSRISQLS